MSAKFPKSKTVYATKLAIPVRFMEVAKENAELISEVTLKAYGFIFEQCKKDLQVGFIVALGLGALFEEYEKGAFTKYEDFDEEAVARENAEILHGVHNRRAKCISKLCENLEGTQVQKAAERLYNEQRSASGALYPDFWDDTVLPETREQYIFAAAVILDEVRNLEAQKDEQ